MVAPIFKGDILQVLFNILSIFLLPRVNDKCGYFGMLKQYSFQSISFEENQ